MYKNKDKQREANRQAMQRIRARKPVSSLSGQNHGLKNARGLPVLDEVGDTQPVIPSCDTPDVIPEQANIPADKREQKRGKDIKCFADLSEDIQETIWSMCRHDGTVNPREVANRTTIAIHYQHQFPGRYYPISLTPDRHIVTGKPGDADYNGICTPEWRAERGR